VVENADRTYVLDGTTFIADPDRNAFTFYVLLPRDLRVSFIPVNPDFLYNDEGAPLLEAAHRARWSVVWVGTEG
jgi:hypothetical protein